MHDRLEDEAFEAFVVRSLVIIVSDLAEIRKQQERIMSGLSNANAALVAVATAVGNLDTAVQVAIAQLVAAKNSGDDAAFQVVADKLTALSSTVNADVSALVSAESPPVASPAPAPAPAPADPAAPAAPAAPVTA